MSSSPTSHPSTPIPLFAQLVQRLRHANARYNQIANQCRRSQRPTHSAKRRAYRAGLRIDTSKACAAWSDNTISTTSTTPALTADGPATETEPKIEIEAEDTPPLGLRRCWSEVVAVEEQLMALGSLSPLLLAYDSSFSFQGPVPGAPRWRSVPLPEMAFEPCTYHSDVGASESADVAHYAGLGIITSLVADRHVG